MMRIRQSEALRNPRWERFAQLLAMGMPQRHAYVEAGYKDAPAHASRLAGSGKVAARVGELLAVAGKVTEKAIADQAGAAEKSVSAKMEFIRKAWLKAAAALDKIDAEDAQAIKAIVDSALAAEKDQRVIDGGVSDRTESQAEVAINDERESVAALLEEYRPAAKQTGGGPVVH